MEATRKFAVICGGSSPEREISLKSGNGVNDALIHIGHDSQIIDFKDLAGLDELTKFDVIFIALHGFEGESGILQDKLESIGVKYTGSNSKGCENTWNKRLCKKLLIKNSLQTPNFVSCNNLEESFNPFVSFFEEHGYDSELFMKPSEDGSSIDIFKISNFEEFEDAKNKCHNKFREFIFEERIRGKEYTVTIINNECFPPIEIKTNNEFYDYDAKYISNETILAEADLSDKDLAKISKVALKAFNVLECNGWARVDFMQDKKGKFHVIEVNTVPGMTTHSCVPKSGSFLGLSYEEVVKKIL